MELSSLDENCEPMDIDLSLNSTKNLDLSTCDTEEPKTVSRSTSPFDIIPFLEKLIKQEPTIESGNSVEPTIEGGYSGPDVNNGTKGLQNVKKYHILMQPKKQECSRFLVKLSVVLVVFVSALFYHVNTLTCIEDLDVTDLRDTLREKLYGQDKAIDLFTRSLDVKVNSKILFIYGGTGVGKTYAKNIIFDKVWNASNVYHYLMPTFKETFPNDLLLGLSFCKSSILVVDDLTRNDFNIKEHINTVIEKSEYLKKNLTVILIYNSDNNEKSFMRNSNTAFFEFELREAFSDIETYKEFIKFEPLTEKHLTLCIKKELGSEVANLNQILKNFNVTQDGCKGVYTKMKLLNIM